MEAETMKRIVAIAIFRITTHRMTHISRVYADLILTSRLELELYERVIGRTGQHVVMGDGVFAPIING
jgi:hypothetical protein